MKKSTFYKASVGINDAGEVTGVAWVFGKPDSVGDIIEPGALTFAKSVPMVREHDDSRVVGIWSEFHDDAAKLSVKGSLFTDAIGPARAAREEAKAKKVTGLSLRFISDSYEPNEHGGTTFKAATVTEISLCRQPVHPGARITAVKSKGAAMDENQNENENENTEVDTSALETQIAELVETVKAVQADNDALKSQVKKVEAKANRPAGDAPKTEEVLKAEAVERWGTYLRNGAQATPADVLKALTVSEDPAAGYLAPKEISSEFIRDLTLQSPVRSVASVRSTGRTSVMYPTRTSITDAKSKDEKEASEESGVTFGQKEIVIKKMTTHVDLSNELLADSGGAAEAEVRLALSEDFGRKEGAQAVNGNGGLELDGFMKHPDIAAFANGHASDLSATALIQMQYAVPTLYANNGVYAMTRKTLGVAMSLTDENGRPLWQASLQVGQPSMLCGRPVIELPDMPEVAGNDFPIVFGDFTGYRLVDREILAVKVNPYTLMEKDMTRFFAVRRLGGGVIQPKKFVKLKMATSL